MADLRPPLPYGCSSGSFPVNSQRCLTASTKQLQPHRSFSVGPSRGPSRRPPTSPSRPPPRRPFVRVTTLFLGPCRSSDRTARTHPDRLPHDRLEPDHHLQLPHPVRPRLLVLALSEPSQFFRPFSLRPGCQQTDPPLLFWLGEGDRSAGARRVKRHDPRWSAAPVHVGSRACERNEGANPDVTSATVADDAGQRAPSSAIDIGVGEPC
jgi:hypothetical protein